MEHQYHHNHNNNQYSDEEEQKEEEYRNTNRYNRVGVIAMTIGGLPTIVEDSTDLVDLGTCAVMSSEFRKPRKSKPYR